jgi:hypothetical protein
MGPVLVILRIPPIVGATFHGMVDRNNWFLLPSDNIIQKYFDALTPFDIVYVATRESFPDIPVCFFSCSNSEFLSGNYRMGILIIALCLCLP